MYTHHQAVQPLSSSSVPFNIGTNITATYIFVYYTEHNIKYINLTESNKFSDKSWNVLIDFKSNIIPGYC